MASKEVMEKKLNGTIPTIKPESLFATIAPSIRPITDEMLKRFEKQRSTDAEKIGLYQAIGKVLSIAKTTGEITFALQLLDTVMQAPEFRSNQFDPRKLPAWVSAIPKLVENRTFYRDSKHFDDVIMEIVKKAKPDKLEAIAAGFSQITKLYRGNGVTSETTAEMKAKMKLLELAFESLSMVWSNPAVDPKIAGDREFILLLASSTNAIETLPSSEYAKARKAYLEILQGPVNSLILRMVERVLVYTEWDVFDVDGHVPDWDKPTTALKSIAKLIKVPGFRAEWMETTINGNFSNNEWPDIICLLDSIADHHPDLLVKEWVKWVIEFSVKMVPKANNFPKLDRAFARAILFDDLGNILDEKNFNRSAFQVLDKVAAEPTYFLAGLQSIWSFIKSGVTKNAEDFAARYKEGESLAKELGLDAKASEICLNLAYGIATIGREKTISLNKNNGIIKFIRYPKELLEQTEVLGGARADKGKLLFMASGTADWNGSFYEDADKLKVLADNYIIVLTEMSSKNEFYDKVRRTAEQYGKINTVIINGHGNSYGVELGSEALSVNNKDELADLRNAFIYEPQVVLISCSTGKRADSIDTVIADAWGAEVFAPVDDAALKNITLDEEGIIKNVKYVGMWDAEEEVGTIRVNAKNR